MKKQRLWCRIICVSLLVFALALTMASCGRSYDKAAGNSAPSKGDYENSYSGSSDGSAGLGALPSGKDDPNAKLIKTAYAHLQTTSYDEALTALFEKIDTYGGYLDEESYYGQSPYRSANIAIRIPAANLDGFKSDLQGLATLTSYTAKKDDVTTAYAVLVGKIETLTVEVGVITELFDVAKESGDLAKIAELEARLTDVKLSLAEAEATLASLDEGIAYSTVHLTLSEVRKIEEPVKEGAFARIGNNFKENLKDIGSFFVELFVFLISAIPYFVILGAAGAVIVIVIIRIKRRKRSGKNRKDD